MAAAVSDPGGTRSLCTLTATDEERLLWYHAFTEGEVGGMRSGALERGGSFTVVDHDKMTDRQRRAARKQMGVQEIRAVVVAESLAHWQTLSRYFSPECARVGVEARRAKPGGEDTLAPMGTADRELRLVALYPYTPAAQAAGEAFVAAERLKERARRVKASHLRVVGAPDVTVEGEGAADASPPVVDLAQGESEVYDPNVMPANAACRAEEWAEAGREEAARRRAQGDWKPAPLAPDQLRDAAVRAIRDAERRKDLPLLSDIRVQAAQAFNAASDAYVRARRTVKGMDGEEKRKAAADRWIRAQTCSNLRSESVDFVSSLESSSRIRTS